MTDNSKSGAPDTVLYDVLVVGAGPAGATTAYYLRELARQRGEALPSVAILEKTPLHEKDKYCGDAWMGVAIDMLSEMGILQELTAKGLLNETLAGGFVSPSGYSFVADDRGVPDAEKNMSTRTFAIKRRICDEAIARRAIAAGCDCFERALVEEAVLDERAGVWTLRCADARAFRGRALVCADGAASNLARKLGIVDTAPNAVAARQYVRGGTHNFKADGVLLYPDYTLPGYMAIFRHYDDSIDLGAYLLPGGNASEEDLADIYTNKIRSDPFVARALGPRWEPLERVKVASLRLGGVPRSYADRVLLVGDAAGMTDPLTGEGIHTSMLGGKIAAEVLLDRLVAAGGDLSAASLRRFHERWWAAFGKDFALSSMAGRALQRFPFLMDAVPVAAAAKGTGEAASTFFAEFGAVMTGVKPKSTFLLPWMALPLARSSLSLAVRRLVWGQSRSYYACSPETDELGRSTSFAAQCFADPTVPMPRAKTKDELADEAVARMFAWGGAPAAGKPAALVLFGSEYGFSEQAARSACDALAAVARPRIVDLAVAADLVDWAKERFVVAVCSTAGDGEPPVDARPFFGRAPPAVRTAVSQLRAGGAAAPKFAVLAPGDSAYPKFCAAGRALSAALAGGGMSALVPDAPCTDLDGDHPELAAAWAARVVEAVRREVADAGNADASATPDATDYLADAAKGNVGLLVRDERATRANPFLATVKSRALLTAPGEPDKHHIVLDVSGAGELLAYLPGDALGVVPLADPSEARRVAALVPGLDASRLATKNLRDVAPELAALLGGASPPEARNEDDASRPWVLDALRAAVSAGRAPPAPDALVGALRELAPRFYSIASSPLADAGEIHLCVAAVRFASAFDGRKLGGAASTFLADRVAVGGRVATFVQRNPDFRLPERPETPKIMVGPGTGVAPFRAFLRHAVASGAASPDSCCSTLFFGCRRADGDFLYRDELLAQRAWRLVTAFSRDTAQRVYVQHRIREPDEGARVWSALDRGGALYVCGDGWRMATDVHEALVDVCEREAPARRFASRADADAFVRGRTHLDVWTV